VSAPREMPWEMPWEEVAALHMTRRGLPDAKPVTIRNDGRYRWLFDYQTADGPLTLLVRWDDTTGKWNTEEID